MKEPFETHKFKIGRAIALVIPALIAVFLLQDSLYQVEPEEVGLVLRFGRYERTTDPGMHAKVPLIERVLFAPARREMKADFGSGGIEANLPDRSFMVTADTGVAAVEWTVHFRVTDPFKFLFKVRDGEEAFRDLAESVMSEAMGDRTLLNVLAMDRKGIEGEVVGRLQELCERFEVGISVDQVVLLNVSPPDRVKPSWEESIEALQERDRLINLARRECDIAAQSEGGAR